MILSVHDHCLTLKHDQHCLHSYQKWQIGQSDCNVTANCGKISQLTSNHLYQHLHTYNHVSRWPSGPSGPLPGLLALSPPPPRPSFPTLKIITYHTPALVYFIFEWQRKMKWIWWWKHHFFCQHIIQPVCCDYPFSIWNCLNTNTLHIILLK